MRDRGYLSDGCLWEREIEDARATSRTIAGAIYRLTGYDAVYARSAFEALRMVAPWSQLTPDQVDAIPAIHRTPFGMHHYYTRDLLRAAGKCPRCAVCGRRVKYGHGRDRVDCWRYCWSTMESKWSREERDKFYEHRDFLTCSRECHDTMARKYRRLTNNLARTRKWLRTSATQLSELKKLLHPHDRRRSPSRTRSTSPDAASAPAAISAT